MSRTITCEVKLDFSWTEFCVLIEHHDNVAGVNSIITSTNMYAVVVIL